jgi:hypothetical protein
MPELADQPVFAPLASFLLPQKILNIFLLNTLIKLGSASDKLISLGLK